MASTPLHPAALTWPAIITAVTYLRQHSFGGERHDQRLERALHDAASREEGLARRVTELERELADEKARAVQVATKHRTDAEAERMRTTTREAKMGETHAAALAAARENALAQGAAQGAAQRQTEVDQAVQKAQAAEGELPRLQIELDKTRATLDQHLQAFDSFKVDREIELRTLRTDLECSRIEAQRERDRAEGVCAASSTVIERGSEMAETNKRAKTQVDPTKFYDEIIPIRSLKEALAYGIRVYQSARALQAVKWPNMHRVAVLGDQNVGKTTFLSMVAYVDLPFSETVHTEGVSVRYTNISADPVGEAVAACDVTAVLNNTTVCIMDVAGRQTPARIIRRVDPFNPGAGAAAEPVDPAADEHGSVAPSEIADDERSISDATTVDPVASVSTRPDQDPQSQRITDRTATDSFVDDVVTSGCDTLVVVLDNVGLQEQSLIEHLLGEREGENGGQVKARSGAAAGQQSNHTWTRLYVVHNVRTVSRIEDLEVTTRRDIEDLFPNPVHVPRNRGRGEYWRTHNDKVLHFCLVKCGEATEEYKRTYRVKNKSFPCPGNSDENGTYDYNDLTIRTIRQFIAVNAQEVLERKEPLVKHVIERFNGSMTRYFEGANVENLKMCLREKAPVAIAPVERQAAEGNEKEIVEAGPAPRPASQAHIELRHFKSPEDTEGVPFSGLSVRYRQMMFTNGNRLVGLPAEVMIAPSDKDIVVFVNHPFNSTVNCYVDKVDKQKLWITGERERFKLVDVMSDNHPAIHQYNVEDTFQYGKFKIYRRLPWAVLEGVEENEYGDGVAVYRFTKAPDTTAGPKVNRPIMRGSRSGQDSSNKAPQA